MKCPNCGKEIDNDSIFCEHCGTKINSKKNRKGLWIGLGVLSIAIIILVVVSVLGINNANKKLRAEERIRIAAADSARIAADSARIAADSARIGIEREEKASTIEREAEQTSKNLPQKASKDQVWIDLGLPSGTLWKDKNESDPYSYGAAVGSFGSKLPTKEQWEELKNSCQWTWTGNGYRIVGPSGASIVLPAAGEWGCTSYEAAHEGSVGSYLSSTPSDSGYAWYLTFHSGYVNMQDDYYCWQSVRLVQD